jgi:oxygen-independent coproporphyrinogen III oxidase
VYAPDGAVLRRGNPRGLDAWLRDPAGGEAERLGPREAAAEGLWTGLRHLPGVDLPAYLARFPAVDRAGVLARARRQVARGNLELVGDRLRVAAGRWLWHDDVAADLLG